MECEACSLITDRLSGAGFTLWQCEVCETDRVSSSTDTPVVCDACSRATGLCIRCAEPVAVAVLREATP